MPIVSIFKNYSDVKEPENMELYEYLEKTRDGHWEDIVTECRLIKDKELRNKFKGTMPTTTLSGEFKYRSNTNLIRHSGYINLDLDDVENLIELKERFQNDSHVYCVFMSTSGTGLRVLFSIEPNKHLEAFKSLTVYVYEKYGVPVDQNNFLSKPFVVSYDPGLWFNPEKPIIFKKYIKEVEIKKLPNFVHTSRDFESIVKQITSRQINICDGYFEYLKVGFAICEQYGEDGRHAFHEVSKVSGKYKFKDVEDQYNQCLKARGQSKANISTFYYLAKIGGVNICSEQTRKIISRTRNSKKVGLKEEAIIENLKKFDFIEGADDLVKKIFDSPDENEYGDDESVLHQLEMYISNNYSLQMNEVTGYLESDGVMLSAGYLNTVFVAAKKLIPKLDYQLMMRLLKSDFIPSYNPFFKFFGSDGVPFELSAIAIEEKNQAKYQSPLIDKLAKTIENDNPKFCHYFLRKWLVSIISSAHKVHSPLLLCLLGAQNSGKTEFFRRLLPKELQGYYAESKLDKEKDDELLMTENLIIMDDELGGKSKQDSLKLKNITSKQYFSLRRPYGDHNEKILRLAVLCGTSNYNEVLADPTGNRRIIPIDVININKELYNSINKKDLFMECYRLYKEGFDWRVNSYDIPYLNNNKVKYEQIVKERELLMHYFQIPIEGDNIGVVKLTTTNILVEIEQLTGQRLSVQTLGRELDNIGFTKKTVSKSENPSQPKMWSIIRINRPNYGKTEEQKKEDLPF